MIVVRGAGVQTGNFSNWKIGKVCPLESAVCIFVFYAICNNCVHCKTGPSYLETA